MLLLYLRITVTLTFLFKVLFPCVTVQMYCPESSSVTLERERVVVVLSSVLFSRVVPLPFPLLWSKTLLHVITDGGKLSTLHIRFRVSPSTTLAFWVILTSFTSTIQKHTLQSHIMLLKHKVSCCKIQPLRNEVVSTHRSHSESLSPLCSRFL